MEAGCLLRRYQRPSRDTLRKAVLEHSGYFAVTAAVVFEARGPKFPFVWVGKNFCDHGILSGQRLCKCAIIPMR